MEPRREPEEEEDYGSASPKSMLGRRGPRRAAGICEGDGSSPSPPRMYCALAAAGGYNSYMLRMMQAMGMPPPPPVPQVVVEPRAAGIKQQAPDPHPANNNNKQLFTFLGFVVAPRLGCCSSRDHPFEIAGRAPTHSAAPTTNRLPCSSLETPSNRVVEHPGDPPPPPLSSAAHEHEHEHGCSLSLSLALDTGTYSGEDGSSLLSSTTSSSSGSRISLDLSLSTLHPSSSN
ncbi:unnamed protein product [Urochloa humidicola]